MRTFTNQRFYKFVLVGGLAAILNFASRIFFDQFMSYVVAIICAYLLGMITAFLLNRLFVFRESRRAVHSQAFYFVVINLLAILQTLIVSLFLAQVLLPALGVEHYREEIAHFFGVVTPVFTSYIGHKRFSFAVK